MRVDVLRRPTRATTGDTRYVQNKDLFGIRVLGRFFRVVVCDSGEEGECEWGAGCANLCLLINIKIGWRGVTL